MERMTVTQSFGEYEGDTFVERAKGDTLNVSVERAEHLREHGLARKKPEERKASGGDAGGAADADAD